MTGYSTFNALDTCLLLGFIAEKGQNKVNIFKRKIFPNIYESFLLRPRPYSFYFTVEVLQKVFTVYKQHSWLI